MKHKLFLSLLLAIFTLNCYAFSWQELWKSKNQQAKEMMKKNDFTTATRTFKDESWRAVAAFRAKDYQVAADLFAKSNTIEANYNLGNALAHLGKYQDAIAAYDKVLKADKSQQDAAYNKEIIEKLLKQQEKQKQQQEKQKQQQEKQKQQQEKQNNPQEKHRPGPAKNNKSPTAPDEQNNSKPHPSLQYAKKTPKQSENKQDFTPQKQNKPNNKDGKSQMQEQWLKLIPDDPGGLLREKFKRDYLRRRGELSS